MSSLTEISPTSKPLLMNLVKQAGLDVTEWEAYGADNPKYCYEWSFMQGNIVVVTLWYENLHERGGQIFSSPTPLKNLLNLSPVQVKRARRLDEIFGTCFQNGWPLRAIISVGRIRDLSKPAAAPSSVRKRMLDPVFWWVQSHEPTTGQYVLVRGRQQPKFVDQFALEEQPDRRERTQQVFMRNARVREVVLQRSEGLCEWCKSKGFETDSGAVYLETHHVIPLSEDGPDHETNVVALCPKHHREAHYGKHRIQMRRILLDIAEAAQRKM